jgi:hypothetical protein
MSRSTFDPQSEHLAYLSVDADRAPLSAMWSPSLQHTLRLDGAPLYHIDQPQDPDDGWKVRRAPFVAPPRPSVSSAGVEVQAWLGGLSETTTVLSWLPKGRYALVRPVALPEASERAVVGNELAPPLPGVRGIRNVAPWYVTAFAWHTDVAPRLAGVWLGVSILNLTPMRGDHQVFFVEVIPPTGGAGGPHCLVVPLQGDLVYDADLYASPQQRAAALEAWSRDGEALASWLVTAG